MSLKNILVKIFPYPVEYSVKLGIFGHIVIHQILKSDIKFQNKSFIIIKHTKLSEYFITYEFHMISAEKVSVP